MRKLLLLTIGLTSIAIASQAQISKGTVLLGGNISGSTNKETSSGSSNEYKNRALHLSPSIGFATSNNKVWGFNASYGSSRSKFEDITSSEYNRYGGGIFYRRYATLGKGFFLFGEANAGYAYSKQKVFTGPIGQLETRTVRTDMANLSVHPGIAYAVHKNFHLEVAINNIANLGYSHQKITTIGNGFGTSTTNKGFSFDSNISNNNPFSIGFRFALGK